MARNEAVSPFFVHVKANWRIPHRSLFFSFPYSALIILLVLVLFGTNCSKENYLSTIHHFQKVLIFNYCDWWTCASNPSGYGILLDCVFFRVTFVFESTAKSRKIFLLALGYRSTYCTRTTSSTRVCLHLTHQQQQTPTEAAAEQRSSFSLSHC